jgi:hypothetical protein
MNSYCRVFLGLVVVALTVIPALADTPGVIVRLNVPMGMVVVDDEESFNAYQLTVSPAQAVSTLRVGQKVILDPKSKTLIAGNSRLVISKAVNLDIRNIKIISVDSAKGIVKAEFVTTGQITNFRVKPEALKKPEMRAGQTVAIGSMATASVDGKCLCGQRNDGTCWCVKNITGCCSSPSTPDCRCDRDRRKDTLPPIW